LLTGSAVAAGLGLTSSIANAAGFVGPYAAGWISQRTEACTAGWRRPAFRYLSRQRWRCFYRAASGLWEKCNSEQTREIQTERLAGFGESLFFTLDGFGIDEPLRFAARPGCFFLTPLRRPTFRRRQISALVESRRAAVSWAVSQRDRAWAFRTFLRCRDGEGRFTLAVALSFGIEKASEEREKTIWQF